MEEQLFTWKTWDTIDTMDFFFYDCELLVPIGEHPMHFAAGTKIKSVAMMYSKGIMESMLRIRTAPRRQTNLHL